MGHKVHPRSVRQGVIYHTFDSNWIAEEGQYGANILEDYKIRRFLTKRLKHASLSRVEIDRKAQRLIIRLITGRPGIVVGRGGQGLDMLRKELQQLTQRKDIQLDVLEVNRIDAEAKLVAESIAQQLEKRAAYRRTMKLAIQRSMRSGVKGIKIMISGRLGGAEIARTEWAKEGRIPLHTFRADVDYGFTEAKTVFGIIGVKVWVFRGEILPGEVATPNIKSRSGGAEDGEGGGPSGRRGREGGRAGDGQRRGRDGNRGRRGPGGGGGGRGGAAPTQSAPAPTSESPQE